MLFDIDFDVRSDQAKKVNVPLETYHQVQQFLFHEARLLDERRWEEWQDLWTEEGMYWIPQQWGQESPYDHISLCWDNKMLRELRFRVLESERNWAQQPITRTSRLINNVMIDGSDDDGCLIVRSVFQVSEWRKNTQRQLAGNYIHKLVADGDSWKIRLKQVNLINCDAAFTPIQIYL